MNVGVFNHSLRLSPQGLAPQPPRRRLFGVGVRLFVVFVLVLVFVFAGSWLRRVIRLPWQGLMAWLRGRARRSFPPAQRIQMKVHKHEGHKMKAARVRIGV